MVLLEQIFHLFIHGSQRIGALVDNLSLCHRALRLFHEMVQTGLKNLLANTSAFQLLDDVVLQRIERLQLFTVFHQHDVITHGGQERLTHFTFLKGIDDILKLLERLARHDPGQFFTIEISPSFQGLIDRVDTLFSLLLFLC